MTRPRLFRVLSVGWLMVCLALLALFVMRFLGHAYPVPIAPFLFAAAAGYAGLWGMDPECRGKFLRSRYLLGPRS